MGFGNAGAIRQERPHTSGGCMERMKPEFVDTVLSIDQKRVMMRVIAEEQEKRSHVVVYLSGAHAYGFPSPDSDLDLSE
jgi:hypothetical protein